MRHPRLLTLPDLDETLRDLADDECIHVTPCFGPEHTCSLACWCKPTPDAEEPRVILHHVHH